MTTATAIAFISWLILALALFFVLPPRRALLAGFLLGFLFLPYTSPNVWALRSRDAIISLPLLVGSVLFGWNAKRRTGFRYADLAMAAWCICPLFSSLSNDLGFYDGLSGVNDYLLSWGVPYFLGRTFFSRLEDLRELAIAVFIGGLIYIPLCLWEVRMSPQLHVWVYGFYPHEFIQSIRYGGFRPTVFLGHGLGVAMWMAFAALTGFWLWSSRSLRTFGKIPTGPLVAALILTLTLCKSLGPLLVFATGSLLKVPLRVLRSSVLILLLLAVPTTYVVLRLKGMLSTASILSTSSQTLDEERTQSFEFRLENEDILVEKARQRPLFGWAGWSRSRVFDIYGKDISPADGLWTITFGVNGFFGLVCLALVFSVPLLSFLRHYPSRVWAHPSIAPAAGLAIFIVLSQIDALFNAPSPPILMLAIGAIAAAAPARLRHAQPERTVGPSMLRRSSSTSHA